MYDDIVERSVLRYVVPFTYEGSFEENVRLVDQQLVSSPRTGSSWPLWNRVTTASDGRESDLYAFIRDELRTPKPARRNELRTQESALGNGQNPIQDVAPASSAAKTGFSWLDYRSRENRDPSLPSRSGGRPVLSFCYVEEQPRYGQTSFPPCRYLDMTNLGLVLYRNHLGLIWYELKGSGGGTVRAQQLMLFQNRLRELNLYYIWLWEIGGAGMPFGIDTCRKKSTPEHREYMRPFLMGAFLASRLSFLQVHFIAERTCHPRQVMTQALLAVSATPNARNAFREIPGADSGKLPQEMPGEPATGQTQRKKEREAAKKQLTSALEEANIPAMLAVPDKALLFTYGALHQGHGKETDEGMNAAFALRDRSKDGHDGSISMSQGMDNMTVSAADMLWKQRFSLAYHLTNGYKDSYHFSEDLIQDMKRPFDNGVWYATQEGAAYLTWPEGDDDQFFRETIVSKIETDYFTLYLKILYQTYSLMIYSRRLHEEIPADIGAFQSGQATGENESPGTEDIPSAARTTGVAEDAAGARQQNPADQRITRARQQDLQADHPASDAARNIETLSQEISLFLTRSMSTSVSHIHHQSEFYNYLKKQLRIPEDVASVTAGVNALSTLERQNRQEAQEEQQRAAEEREKESDNQIQAVIGLFGLLTVFSALIDCYDIIDKFREDYWGLPLGFKIWEGVFLAIIIIGFIIAFRFAWKSIKDAWKKK